MKKKQSKQTFDKNFFKEMNYEIAGDIGAIDNEDMMNNKKLNYKNSKENNTKKKK